eukprot:8081899-Alexandrium_andersonii.AAC.1
MSASLVGSEMCIRDRDCADCGLEFANSRCRDLGPPSIHTVGGRSGVYARSGAECTPWEFRGAKVEAVLGPARFKPRMPEVILHCTHGGIFGR